MKACAKHEAYQWESIESILKRRHDDQIFTFDFCLLEAFSDLLLSPSHPLLPPQWWLRELIAAGLGLWSNLFQDFLLLVRYSISLFAIKLHYSSRCQFKIWKSAIACFACKEAEVKASSLESKSILRLPAFSSSFLSFFSFPFYAPTSL